MQDQFTPEQTHRWEQWQEAQVRNGRRADLLAGVMGPIMLGAMLAGAVALWLR